MKRPSWMITPASTSPAATAGMMRSKGITTRLRPPPVNRPDRRAAVVSSPGMAMRAWLSSSASEAVPPLASAGPEARVLARHDERPAAPAQRAAGVQQRVPVA